MRFKTPILFLGFNRPDTTKQVLRVLEKLQPDILYVAIDGPRKNVPGDLKKCDEVKVLFDSLNWSCAVHKRFLDQNLGCGFAVSSAITWFFENVEEGIIIEDDCIPDISFFYYCASLLEYYRANENIFHIGGNNYQDGIKRGNGDYYFSIFPHIWGWATWRRAWLKYSIIVPEKLSMRQRNFVKSRRIIQTFDKKFMAVRSNRIDTWDYQWQYWCWYYNGLSITPNINLVSNIGFGIDSTHTKQENSIQSNMPSHPINRELKHPSVIKINKKADRYTFNKIFKSRKNLRYYLSLIKQKIVE